VFFAIPITLLLVLIRIEPLYKKIQTGLITVLGTLFIVLTVPLLKNVIPSKRPACAKNCNILNQGGDASDENGMPSGHMSMAAFLVTLLFFNSGLFVRSISVLWLLAVGWSRYYKSCHTVAQIVGGLIYGSVIGRLFV